MRWLEGSLVDGMVIYTRGLRFGGRGTQLQTCSHVYSEYRREEGELISSRDIPLSPPGVNSTPKLHSQTS